MKMKSELSELQLTYETLGRVFDYAAQEENKGLVRVIRAQYDIGSEPSNPTFYIDINVNYDRPEQSSVEKLSGLMKIIESDKIISKDNTLHTNMGNLDFSVRARRLLQRFGLINSSTVEELSNLTEENLRSVNNCGKVTINEIKRELAKYGLTLKKS